MIFKTTFFVFSFIFLLSSCSHFQKFAVESSSGIFYSASFEMETEGSFENLEKGILPNLKTAEGMLFIDPTNRDLLATLTKGYSGYALAVDETHLLEDTYAKRDISSSKNQAIYNHSKAVEYAFRYLKTREIDLQTLTASLTEKNGITTQLDEQLISGKKDNEVLFYLSMSLASLINLQKNKTSLIAQLPLLTQIMEWVCKKEPTLNSGACDLFFASLEASRPKALGGNPEKAKKHFLEGIKNYPENDLIRLFYVQVFLIPTLDEKTYAEQMNILEANEKNFVERIQWGPSREEETLEQKKLHFYKALAYKRVHILRKFEKELF